MKPLEKKILEDFDLSDFIVCTDSGLSSGDNKFMNSRKNRNFVTAASLKKIKKTRRDKFLTHDGWFHIGDKKKTEYNLDEIEQDLELYKTYYNETFYKEEWYIDKEDVYDEVLKKQ